MSMIKKGVTYDLVTNAVVDCIFCNIRDKKEPSSMVFEDDLFMVFHNIAPVTHLHLLVCPKKHIQNLSVLRGAEGVELVKQLVEVGKNAVGAETLAEGVQFSFHIPPYNSIDHLHLHVIASPQTMSWSNCLKYGTSLWFSKSSDQMIEIFSAQQKTNK